MTGNDTIKCAADGGCTPVKEIRDEVFKKRKIPWTALIWIFPLFLTIIGTMAGIIFAEGRENAKANVKTSERVTRLEEKYASIDKNTAEILLILRRQIKEKQDDKKIETEKEKE